MSYGPDKLKIGWILTEVKFDLEGQGQLPPLNNRDLNQGVLHLWSKFGDPSLNGSRVIARTSKWLTHRQTDRQTHTHTDAGNDNTRRPKLASGKNESGTMLIECSHNDMTDVNNCHGETDSISWQITADTTKTWVTIIQSSAWPSFGEKVPRDLSWTTALDVLDWLPWPVNKH